MEFCRWIRISWDRAAAIAAVVAAGIMLLAAWFRISHTPYPAEQLPLIVSGGIGGVFFVAVGTALWVSADLRDEWNKLDSIDEALHELAGSTLVNNDALSNGNGSTQSFDETTKGSTARDASISQMGPAEEAWGGIQPGMGRAVRPSGRSR